MSEGLKKTTKKAAEKEFVVPGAVLSVLLLFSSHSLAELIDGEELADPTRPPMATDVLAIQASAPELEQTPAQRFSLSFVRSGAQPLAVINQQPVRTGDRIGGAEVLAIASGSVTLLVDGREHVLQTYASQVKKKNQSSTQY